MIRYRKDGAWGNYPNLRIRSQGVWEGLRYIFGADPPIWVDIEDPRYPWQPGDPDDPGPRQITPWRVLQAFEAPYLQPPTPFLGVTPAPGWENQGDEDEDGNPRPADSVTITVGQMPEGVIPRSWYRQLVFNLDGEEIVEYVPDHNITSWNLGEWPYKDGNVTCRLQYVNEVGGGPISAASQTHFIYGPPELREP